MLRAILVVVLLAFVAPAHAVSCADRRSFEEAFAESTDVLLVMVTSSTLSLMADQTFDDVDAYWVTATVKTQRVLKGTADGVKTLTTAFHQNRLDAKMSVSVPGNASPFTPGQRYLVFGRGEDSIRVGVCSRTQRWQHGSVVAANLLRRLEALADEHAIENLD